MGDKLCKFILFAAGAAIGSVVTWKLVKTKYEQIARDEIASVKKVFSYKKTELEQTEGEKAIKSNVNQDTFDFSKFNTDSDDTNKDRIDYSKIVTDLGYKNKEEDKSMEGRPYVISPEEFGEIPEYDTVSLVWWNDNVLTTDCNDVLNDVDDLIGEESLDHFGEYEDDSVFVRDDTNKTDYEILKDVRNFHDVY